MVPITGKVPKKGDDKGWERLNYWASRTYAWRMLPAANRYTKWTPKPPRLKSFKGFLRAAR